MASWKTPFDLGVNAFREERFENAIKHLTEASTLPSLLVPAAAQGTIYC